MDSETLSRTLARYVAGLRFEQLSADVVAMARLTYLDWLGNVLVGATQPPGQMARSVARRLGQAAESVLLHPGGTVGAGERWVGMYGPLASAPAAAFANGVAAHVIELDDVHKGSTLHAGAPVVAAALAACQRSGAGGKRLVEAIVAGFEVAVRVGEAVNPSHYRYWHPTGTAATFGAAAAAGKALGLDEEALVHALGSAGTQAAGLWEFLADGAMSKHLHPGKAALNGLLAADLAREGFTGASRIIEGPRGFARATSQEPDFSRITEGLGGRPKLLENCFKIHACCGHTHSAIDVAMALADEAGVAAAEVEAVRVGTYQVARDLVDNPAPVNVYQAKFSLQYTVAAGLLYRKVGLGQFGLPYLADTQLQALMARVRVAVDPDVDRHYPAQWGTRVTIDLKDGRCLHGEAAYPKGNPENPVSAELLERKFEELAGLVLPARAVEEALRSARRLESCPHTALLPGGWRGLE
jgi:2-methylcitrate dehydratase PrpD